jgi:hypothetical protein
MLVGHPHIYESIVVDVTERKGGRLRGRVRWFQVVLSKRASLVEVDIDLIRLTPNACDNIEEAVSIYIPQLQRTRVVRQAAEGSTSSCVHTCVARRTQYHHGWMGCAGADDKIDTLVPVKIAGCK